MTQFTWSRHPDLLAPGYEVSTQGDRRFSALCARLDGKTIEQIYQLDVKGYRKYSSDWRIGKGQQTLLGQSRELLWEQYLALWQRWSATRPGLMAELRDRAADHGYLLTDCFATTEINQAHALSVILNEMNP